MAQTSFDYPAYETDADPNGLQNLKGEGLTLAPDITANLGSDMFFPLEGSTKVPANFNARYADEYNAADNDDGRTIQGDSWMIDATIRIDNVFSDGVSLALTGRNLTSEYITTSYGNKSGTVTGKLRTTPQRGRQSAIEVGYRF